MRTCMASERAKAIGERIRERRQVLGLTQEELARKTESTTITGNVISRWERGENRPSDTSLELLAAGLELEVGYLRFGNDRPLSLPTPRDDSQFLDRLDRIENHLGTIAEALRSATAPGLETLVQNALRDLGVDPEALPRTSPAAQPPAAPARKPPRRRRQANG